VRKTCLGGGAACLLALAGMSGVAAASTTACAGADAFPTRGNLVQIRSAITCLVNEQRVLHGIPVLRTAGALRDAALRHSADMVRRSYFGHVTPSGVGVRARLARAGVRPRSIGENIGWGMGDQSSPLALVSGWMHSAPHRANILSRRFTATGVGVALGAPGRPGLPYAATFTQVFAGR
jgi:uncharacterized protein YkwD